MRAGTPCRSLRSSLVAQRGGGEKPGWCPATVMELEPRCVDSLMEVAGELARPEFSFWQREVDLMGRAQMVWRSDQPKLRRLGVMARSAVKGPVLTSMFTLLELV